ncbi:MAG: hypothetical protein HOV68_27600 [Streptomycetaceae bacterium]|nr:hypothetical protein [Streptomycetaceae bacterium]
MSERIQQPLDQHSPQERVAALQQQAAADYATAQARRDALSHEDRVHGMEIGSTA